MIVCFGTTFREAPVALRERLVVSAPDVLDALLGPGIESRAVEGPCLELACLSTCNRTEVYAVVADPEAGPDLAFEALAEWFVSHRGLSRDILEQSFYRHEGIEAVRHLSRVAAGLDSLVLGESEIARQVADALQAARAVGAVDMVLSQAFRSAIRAGRRARAETGISRKPASVSSVAVGLADEASGTLAGKRVLLVGTGKVGKLACAALGGKGAAPFRVLSRNPDHAADLAGQFRATSGSLADLAAALLEADVVISSTGAPNVILDRPAVERAMAQRPERPLTVIDIAVPRDVDASVRDVAGVALFDIDDLQGRIDHHVAARADQVSSVEDIIEEELENFGARHEQLGVRPLIADLRSRAEDIRRREVASTLQRLGDVDEATRMQVEHLSRSLVNKLLHEPTIRLRSDAARYQSEDVADLARELFGLEEGRASYAP